MCAHLQFTQSTHASVDAWMDLVRSLPEDPPFESLMSQSALKATIIRIYDLRMTDIMKSPNPHELVSRDSVFDSISNYFNQQFAGDGEEIYMPELMQVDGPVARLLMSCRYGIETTASIAMLPQTTYQWQGVFNSLGHHVSHTCAAADRMSGGQNVSSGRVTQT
jgi:DNA-binding protein Fis